MIRDFSIETLELASDYIGRGELVAFPVEHGYAVGCEPFNAQAVRRLLAARGASEGVSIPLFIGYRSALEGVAAQIDPAVQQLLIGAWPGLLTVVTKSAVTWDLGDGGGALISVRQPLDTIALQLTQLHGPIAATTAAKVGGRALTASDVVAELGDAVSLIIDGGARPEGLPSTLLRCVGSRVSILRAGALSPGEISRLSPDLVLLEPDALG